MKFRLKNLREEYGMTQQELADKLFLTQKTINSYERGRTQPNMETLCKLSDIFDTSIDYLLGNTDVRYSYALAEDKELVEQERCLVKNFRKLSDGTKNHIMGIIESCLDKT
ncbi:MAG: helix-turn-helix transcriptional regulator [Oscillospiraceae bacterium]|nr:helix-turn-helix transcriptional regulator [Oscillospiraceae bacterium]